MYCTEKVHVSAVLASHGCQLLRLACKLSMSVSGCTGDRPISVSAAKANAVVCSWS